MLDSLNEARLPVTWRVVRQTALLAAGAGALYTLHRHSSEVATAARAGALAFQQAAAAPQDALGHMATAVTDATLPLRNLVSDDVFVQAEAMANAKSSRKTAAKVRARAIATATVNHVRSDEASEVRNAADGKLLFTPVEAMTHWIMQNNVRNMTDTNGKVDWHTFEKQSLTDQELESFGEFLAVNTAGATTRDHGERMQVPYFRALFQHFAKDTAAEQRRRTNAGEPLIPAEDLPGRFVSWVGVRMFPDSNPERARYTRRLVFGAERGLVQWRAADDARWHECDAAERQAEQGPYQTHAELPDGSSVEVSPHGLVARWVQTERTRDMSGVVRGIRALPTALGAAYRASPLARVVNGFSSAERESGLATQNAPQPEQLEAAAHSVARTVNRDDLQLGAAAAAFPIADPDDAITEHAGAWQDEMATTVGRTVGATAALGGGLAGGGLAFMAGGPVLGGIAVGAATMGALWGSAADYVTRKAYNATEAVTVKYYSPESIVSAPVHRTYSDDEARRIQSDAWGYRTGTQEQRDAFEFVSKFVADEVEHARRESIASRQPSGEQAFYFWLYRDLQETTMRDEIAVRIMQNLAQESGPRPVDPKQVYKELADASKEDGGFWEWFSDHYRAQRRRVGQAAKKVLSEMAKRALETT